MQPCTVDIEYWQIHRKCSLTITKPHKGGSPGRETCVNWKSILQLFYLLWRLNGWAFFCRVWKKPTLVVPQVGMVRYLAIGSVQGWKPSPLLPQLGSRHPPPPIHLQYPSQKDCPKGVFPARMYHCCSIKVLFPQKCRDWKCWHVWYRSQTWFDYDVIMYCQPP